MARIFISSTFEDLRVHRAAVTAVLRQMQHDVIGMEDYAVASLRNAVRFPISRPAHSRCVLGACTASSTPLKTSSSSAGVSGFSKLQKVLRAWTTLHGHGPIDTKRETTAKEAVRKWAAEHADTKRELITEMEKLRKK